MESGMLIGVGLGSAFCFEGDDGIMCAECKDETGSA
jgi:hypothetical protein